MKISVVIPSRGDVGLKQILASIPTEHEIVVCDNSIGCVWRVGPGHDGLAYQRPAKSWSFVDGDLGAYGRYRAITHATGDVIVTQDDDCVVDDPDWQRLGEAYEPGVLTALMPASRTDYTDTVLIGWGAIFDRHLPEFAFAHWTQTMAGDPDERARETSSAFRVVGADFVFPMLTPHKRLDAEHTDLPWAHADNRTWGQPGYAETKQWYLDRAREVRD